MPSKVLSKSSKTSPDCVTTGELREDLDYFIQTTESCLGPSGQIKMIVSGTGNMMITSSSHRLWSLIQIDHVLAEFILQSTKHLPDHRLFAASLTARLLRDNIENIDIHKIVEVIDKAAVPFDVSNLKNLRNLVKSIIRPKAKVMGLMDKNIDHLCCKIVKAWLMTVPDDPEQEMGEVVVKTLESPLDNSDDNDVKIVHGLLYPLDEDNKVRSRPGPIKVNLSLDNLVNLLLSSDCSVQHHDGQAPD